VVVFLRNVSIGVICSHYVVYVVLVNSEGPFRKVESVNACGSFEVMCLMYVDIIKSDKELNPSSDFSREKEIGMIW
jgi:hypothetical protein